MTKPETFNVEIGKRLKIRRKLLGYNAVQFAQMLNVSTQQLYKYEAGIDRITAMKICEIAKLLDVSLSYFFDKAYTGSNTANSSSYIPPNVLDDKETQDLVKFYVSLEDTRTRLAFVDLVKSVAKYYTKTQSKHSVHKIV